MSFIRKSQLTAGWQGVWIHNEGLFANASPKFAACCEFILEALSIRQSRMVSASAYAAGKHLIKVTLKFASMVLLREQLSAMPETLANEVSLVRRYAERVPGM